MDLICFKRILFLISGLSLLSFGSQELQADKVRVSFEPRLAFKHVEELVSFGPRPSGSPGIAKAQSYISAVLKQLPVELEHQDFLAATPNGRISMKNIIAKAPGQNDQLILLASHYDTKLMTDTYFVGANDGGSSSGLLLELARVISQRERRNSVWFVFFDGEEAQREWTDADSLYGSRYLVERLKAEGYTRKVKAMILMDMIGDKDLVLEKDLSSTPWLIDLVWQSARELGYSKHLTSHPKAIVDDHIPFIQAGIPAVNLIDYSFGFGNLYWHSSRDTLDKISPASLKIVGEVVLKTLEKIFAR